MKTIFLTILSIVFTFSLKAADTYKVTRVIDGDTLILETLGRVRLIGVDTPETVHPSKPVEYFGLEASNFTKKLVEGKPVSIEFEGNRRDRFGRLLGYVYLEDGVLVNAKIIQEGYGFAYTKYPFGKMDSFRRYEKEARENNRGLWNKGSSK